MRTWAAGGNINGSLPSTAVAPDDTTNGALFFSPNFLGSSAKKRVIAAAGHSCNLPGSLTQFALQQIIIDRLSHQGGLSGIVATPQTTNLPTAALTRYTDGVGVMIAIEIYTQVGTTATNLTVSYTNSSGVGGRVTKPIDFGGSTLRQNGHVFILPLQDDDIGVKSVESVTLAGTTGTAGNFGVTLFKPLLAVPGFGTWTKDTARDYNGLIGLGTLPEVKNNACIDSFGFSYKQNFSPTTLGQISILEVPD